MLLTLILGLIFTYCVYRLISRSPNLPPGPFNLPIVGYIPFLRRPVHQHFEKLSIKYGEIFSLNLGNKRVVVLSSLNSIRDALKQDVFTGRPDFPLFFIGSENKKGIIFSEGESWSEMRRFTLRTLRDFGLGKSTLESIIQDEVKELVEILRNNTGHPIELNNQFNLAVVNALWTITTGERIRHDDQHMKSLVKTITLQFQETSAGNIGLFLPFVNYFPPFKTMLDKHNNNVANIKATMLEIVRKHRKNQNASGESDLIHAFLEKVKDCTDANSPFNESVAERQLVVTLLDLFAAGTETTSTSLLWFFFLMATYPEIQKRVQREIDDIVPDNELPSFQHRSKLVYMEAVLMETLRFSSLAPLSVFHVALQNAKLGPYLIPKGTILIPNLHQVMHDPQLWERPNEFYPEHFLNQDGSLKNSEALIPFSTGKRACLGETLAKTEFFLFTSTLLKSFTFSFPSMEKKLSLEPVEGLTLTPQPYKVILTVR